MHFQAEFKVDLVGTGTLVQTVSIAFPKSLDEKDALRLALGWGQKLNQPFPNFAKPAAFMSSFKRVGDRKYITSSNAQKTMLAISRIAGRVIGPVRT